MDIERKTVKKTLPPRLFFVGGSWVESLGGFLGGSRCGFCLILHVEFCGIIRFSLMMWKLGFSCVVEDVGGFCAVKMSGSRQA
jgi:hypothetical protein